MLNINFVFVLLVLFDFSKRCVGDNFISVKSSLLKVGTSKLSLSIYLFPPNSWCFTGFKNMKNEDPMLRSRDIVKTKRYVFYVPTLIFLSLLVNHSLSTFGFRISTILKL